MNRFRSHADLAVWEKILALDLGPIRFKVALETGCSVAHVDSLERWYRRFLFLSYKHPSRALVLPKSVDVFWHHHILDTRKYADDCQNVFGKLLHHFPYFGLRGPDDHDDLLRCFRETTDLMRAEFGTDVQDHLAGLDGWPVDFFDATSCSDCTTDTIRSDRPSL